MLVVNQAHLTLVAVVEVQVTSEHKVDLETLVRVTVKLVQVLVVLALLFFVFLVSLLQRSLV